MERSLRIKTLVLLALVLISGVYLVPTFVAEDHLPGWFTRVFDKRVKLGLDLQGGLHIVYRVDLDKVISGKGVAAGDVVIGVKSSGIHSNGLTLARKRD